MLKHVNGKLVSVDEPAINAVNSRLCDDFIADCEQVLATWNKAITDHGYDYRLSLPSRAFHRAVGEFSDIYATPDGNVVGQAEWDRRREEWLPDKDDLEFLLSLMEQVTEPGKFAHWIAPPRAGINGKPGDFEYVRIAA